LDVASAIENGHDIDVFLPYRIDEPVRRDDELPIL
jgi:hypothetical protein